MSSMESFYGGRQGASFVIVKRFDGINIADTAALARKEVAVNSENKYLTLDGNTLIYKDGNNQGDYSWGDITLDGTSVSAIQVSSGDPATIKLPNLMLESMVDCFKKGGETTSEVGYGEYVIIDTLLNLNDPSSVDNGKVFRRGMNYDSDLGGAEYIGQIVGPKGDTPILEMNTIEEILSRGGRHEFYTVANDSLVPGIDYEESDPSKKYNDSIEYGWSDIYVNVDPERHIKKYVGSMIGFRFPYLVPEFKTNGRSAYYEVGDERPAGKEVGDVLADDFDVLVYNGEGADQDPHHGDTGHPFYRKWKMSIPKGIKGDSASQFEVIPRKIREDAPLWASPDIAQEPVDTADANTTVKFTNDPWTPSEVLEVTKENETYYAKLEDAWNFILRYRETVFDNKESGEPPEDWHDEELKDIYEFVSVDQMKIEEVEKQGNTETDLFVRFTDSNEWHNLGKVPEGKPGGVSIVGKIELNEGQEYTDVLRPGHDAANMMGNPAYKGWAYIISEYVAEGRRPQKLYGYDYQPNVLDWFEITCLGTGGGGDVSDPTQVVIVDESKVVNNKVVPKDYEDVPVQDGLWFVQSSVITAY